MKYVIKKKDVKDLIQTTNAFIVKLIKENDFALIDAMNSDSDHPNVADVNSSSLKLWTNSRFLSYAIVKTLESVVQFTVDSVTENKQFEIKILQSNNGGCGDIIFIETDHPDLRPKPPLDFDIENVKEYLTYIFYKKTFDIVPYSEIDALYVQHRLQDREKALLEDSDSVGDKRDRTGTGTGAGEGDEPFVPLPLLPLPGSEGNSPVDAEIEELSSSTSLFNEPLNLDMSVSDFGIYIGKKLDVHPARLAFIITVTDDNPKEVIPFLTGDDPRFIDKQRMGKVTLNQKLQIFNRQQFKLTPYTLHYIVLPYHVYDNAQCDIRYSGKANEKKEDALRYMEFFVTDSRIRIWRQLFLDQLRIKEKGEGDEVGSTGDVTGTGRSYVISNHSIKKRRMKEKGEDDEGSKFIWPEIPASDQVPGEFMTASKVRWIYVYVQSYLGEDFYMYIQSL
mmetsp:Transcript_10480/g.10107  ORF Transcript_10480/g.10107 Transcript_10480/m.10107 type:complete len:449 (+) Transcript_10480:1761-3107(+)